MKLRWEVCGTVGDAIPPTNVRDPTAFFRVQMKYSDSIRREMNDICIISHSFVVQKSSHSGDWVLYVKLWQQFLFENDHGRPQVCSQGMGLMSDASAQRTTSTSTTTGRRGRLLSSTSSPFDWESFNSLSPSPFSAKVRSSSPIFSHRQSDLRKAH